ncbi:MAG: hypothetical protein Q9227_004974 [Pyrenula ochraceoflavens]
MTNPSNATNSIKLQSADHEELLNIIDQLRSQGVSRFVDLPQLIVCGDQSSGKSSVLEAVSGIQFPTSDNLCTRFATELILRRGPKLPIKCTIIVRGGPKYDENGQKSTKLVHQCDRVEEIPATIESAKSCMGLTDNTKSFSNDLLRIEVSGPTQPHLTLVDLPGLFHAGNKVQSTKEAEIVKSLVLSYMKKQRSIILAVVSAKNDYANQIVTTYSSEQDPQGLRTLGIITKPDALPPGSESEKSFVELAQNKDVNFRLGWHVLRNRDYGMRNASAEERDAKEAEFFSTGIWNAMPPSILGIGTLKPRLSMVLKDQILSELPNLIKDVQSSLHDTTERLGRLGVARGNVEEQRVYLQKVGADFSSLMSAAIGGQYNSQFFGSAMLDKGYKKRLRAVVQNMCVEFADQMRTYGHEKEIRDYVEEDQEMKESEEDEEDVEEEDGEDEEGEEEELEPEVSIPQIVSRDKYLDNVGRLMQRTRGCELPGTFNPHIIGELFFEQSRPWGELVCGFMNDVLNATTATIHLILVHVADPLTGDNLLRRVVNPALAEIRQNLDDRVKELLEPHQHGHPITYNHYFTDNIQKARQDASRKHINKKLTAFFNPSSHGNVVNAAFKISSLTKSIMQDTEKDMDRHACSEATDCMLAYYKVALKSLIDDVTKLGLEKNLMSKLPQILTSQTVNGLSNESVNAIAGETEVSQAERKRLTEKSNVLKKSLDTLHQLDRHKPKN